MKKIIFLSILCFTISLANEDIMIINSSNGSADYSIFVFGNADLYQKYIAKWKEFSQLLTLPGSFETMKSSFLLPKDNPKYETYDKRIKSEVLDELEKTINTNGPAMQKKMMTPNVQLFTDQSYIQLMSFTGSAEVMNQMQKLIALQQNAGDLTTQADAEFKQNIDAVRAQYNCANFPEGSAAQKSCGEASNNLLVDKNKATVKKYYEQLKPIYSRYIDETKKVFEYFASLVRGLKFPNDDQVKFTVQTDAKQVYTYLYAPIDFIKICHDWNEKYMLEKP